MKRYEKKVQGRSNSHLKEMANITPKYSGIIKGIVQIRPEQRHIFFPHVHFVWDVKKAENEYVKISIGDDNEDIYVIEEKNMTLRTKELARVKEFIQANSHLLKKYYLQAEFLDTIELLTNIQKI